MKRRRLSLTTRKSLTGHLFVLPLYIGFLVFVLPPLFQSIVFAFSDVVMDPDGYHMTMVGLENIRYIFTVDADYSRWLLESIANLFWQVPVILIASLFIAVILKSKFHGRTVVRAIFFLPVIIASGIIINIVKGDTVANSVLTGNVVSAGTVFQSTGLSDFLVRSGFSSSVVSFVTNIYNNMFDLLWKTGIQTIIFLAALQSISPSLYEASAMEGATAWEDFWKITVPMITPMILLNTLYTIIDSFMGADNYIMYKVMNNMKELRVDMAAAMAWVYFLVIAVVLLLVTWAFSRVTRSRNR